MMTMMHMKVIMIHRSKEVIPDLVKDVKNIFDYLKTNVSNSVKDRFKGNSSMLQLIDYSIKVGDILMKNLDSIKAFMHTVNRIS